LDRVEVHPELILNFFGQSQIRFLRGRAHEFKPLHSLPPPQRTSYSFTARPLPSWNFLGKEIRPRRRTAAVPRHKVRDGSGRPAYASARRESKVHRIGNSIPRKIPPAAAPAITQPRSAAAVLRFGRFQQPFIRVTGRLLAGPPSDDLQVQVPEGPYSVEVNEVGERLADHPRAVLRKERANGAIRKVSVTRSDPRSRRYRARPEPPSLGTLLRVRNCGQKYGCLPKSR